jgi:hypothetical protein
MSEIVLQLENRLHRLHEQLGEQTDKGSESGISLINSEIRKVQEHLKAQMEMEDENEF